MPRGDRGYAYVMLLLLLATMSVAVTGSVLAGHEMQRRSAEQALRAVGDDWRLALTSYRAHDGTGPAQLDDLLRDKRFAGLRRHMRRIPHDPLTGSMTWGVVRDPNTTGIVGVYSLAPGRPIQRTGFEGSEASFENADGYATWVFGIARPGT